MQFLYQPLTWGFLLIGVPILIHLINLLRHRKQKWAAMDFLLESYRRNRRWVMLKQWLLLLSRILAMILLVAMLAKWVSGARWLSWIGGQTTHHYVLLDDSYSMAELDQNESAYGRGLKALAGLVRSIAGSPGEHQITLLRWSRASLALANQGTDGRLDAAADLNGKNIPTDPSHLLDRINATEPTPLQLSPESALELVSPMIAKNIDQQSVVYLLTDLRRNEFGEPETLGNQLSALTDASTQVNIVDCGRTPGRNLSIVSLAPEQEIWAVRVPLMVRFQVRNRTNRDAKNVVVRVRSITYAEGGVTPSAQTPYSGDAVDLPPVVIDQISAGETVTRQVQVIFGVPGDHVVETSIADDVLQIDNRRWCTVSIKPYQRVLLVDGEPKQTNAFYFEKAINPDARFSTGMSVERVDASYLRDAPPASLGEYDAIGLLDVPRLDDQAIEKLEGYCRDGGGVFISCGRNTNLRFVNDKLYRQGEGIFPVPVRQIESFQPGVNSGNPDVSADEHPILAPLLSLENSPFFLLQIRKLLTTDPGAAEKPGLKRVVSGPDKHPLLIDKAFGEGHVVTLMTGLTSEWSNWAQDPTFVVMALRSLGYLGSFRRPPTSQPAGSTIAMTVVGQTVLPDAELLIPAREEGMRVRLQQAVEQSEEGQVASLELGVSLDETERAVLDSLLRVGVFEAWMTNAQGEFLVKNFAHNAPAAEGDLERISHSDLEQKLGIPVRIQSARKLMDRGLNSQESTYSTTLLVLLGMLLLAEQALAYSASFHAPLGVRP